MKTLIIAALVCFFTYQITKTLDSAIHQEQARQIALCEAAAIDRKCAWVAVVVAK